MIEHVYRRVSAARGLADVIVATDDLRIATRVHDFGGKVRLTKATHATGTDRLAEVVASMDCDVVVNVQGDEPLIEPALINGCASLLATRADCVMSTAAHPIKAAAEFLDPNVVKVVLDANSRALYFSRAAIPHRRDRPASLDSPEPITALRHVGLYAYRAGFLRSFSTLPPSPLEPIEALEQLRVLWNGERIAVHVSATSPGIGVDTPDDLARARAMFA